jgi:hypothetical protein
MRAAFCARAAWWTPGGRAKRQSCRFVVALSLKMSDPVPFERRIARMEIPA